MNIQWFPGHMKKAQRMIEENLKLVDAVCEVLDARIPVSSANPDVAALIRTKPRLIILNRIDLADGEVTAKWRASFKSGGLGVLETDSKSGKGVSGLASALRVLLSDKIKAYEAKGQAGRPLRAMVLGIPNVGKSAFINRAAGRKAAKAENRPGVTRGKQWIAVDKRLELLDTPGILWPRFDDPLTGLNLAFTGAVKDDIVDKVELAAKLCETLRDMYPGALSSRYGDGVFEKSGGFEILESAAVSRSMLGSGGVPDTERMATALLDDFRAGRLGRMSLERPSGN